MRVRELMSRPVPTVTPGASSHEAVTPRCRHRVRHGGEPGTPVTPELDVVVSSP